MLRCERSRDHHGLDIGEGCVIGMLDVKRVLILLACVSNQSSKGLTRHEEGGGGGTKEGRVGKIGDQYVLVQLGEGSRSLNLGESSVITTGTWSEPEDGSGVSHLATEGKRCSLAKKRSRTEGLALCAKGKCV